MLITIWSIVISIMIINDTIIKCCSMFAIDDAAGNKNNNDNIDSIDFLAVIV